MNPGAGFRVDAEEPADPSPPGSFMTHRALPLLLLLPVILLAGGASLPEDGPLPPKKPAGAAAPVPAPKDAPKSEVTSEPPSEDDAASPQVPPTTAVPTPKEKPDEPAPTTAPSTEAEPPAQGKPDTQAPASPDAATKEGEKPEAKSDTTAKTEPAPPAPLAIEAEDPKAYAQCLSDLKAMGATFEETARIDDGKGCGIDKPLVVTDILPGVTLKPKATLRCEAALELARWTREAVLPAAGTAVPEDGALTTINQASSYICRLRNNAATGKISEHARGNAIDIASFTFKSGKTIAIQPRDEDSTLTGAFQRAVTATGCLYFETVLDPGSDEAHEDHLHFDVLQRRGGYRYCR